MRFSLQSLFFSFVLIWSSLAAFGGHGIWIAGVLFALAALLRLSESPGRRLAEIVLVLLCIFVFGSLLLPPAIGHRQLGPQTCCLYNIKELALALQSYNAIHGSFPPAYVADADGKPMHSWRVLILPHLGRNDLYRRYNFNQPWDSPKNQRLARSMPEVFRCPGDPAPDSNCTNYVAVVGANTAWLGSTPRKVTDFGEDADKTIFLVEIDDSEINWLEPHDLTFEEARTGIHAAGESGISSHHGEDARYFQHTDPEVNVGFVTGYTDSLPTRTPPEILEALLSVGGPKPTDWDPPEQARRLRWDRIVALIAMASTFLWLVIRPRRVEE